MRTLRTTLHKGMVAIAPVRDGVALIRLGKSTSGDVRVVSYGLIEKAPWEAKTLETLAAAAKCRKARMVTLFDHTSYQAFATDAPEVPEAEYREALRWTNKDWFGYPPEEAVIEYLKLPQGQFDRERLYVFAATRGEVQAAVEPFHVANLTLSGIEVPEIALCRIARLIHPEGTVLLVHSDGQRGLLTVCQNGALLYARHLELGMSETPALAESLVSVLQRSIELVSRQQGDTADARCLLVLPRRYETTFTRYAQPLGLNVGPLDLSRQIDFAAYPELATAELQSRLLPLIGAALREEDE